MPDRMTTASVLEYMSEREPEAKVLSNRTSADCSKQSHAVNVKLKRKDLNIVQLGQKQDQIVHGFVHAWLTPKASSSKSSALLELIQREESKIDQIKNKMVQRESKIDQIKSKINQRR